MKCAFDVAGRRSSPVSVRPVAVRWMWLSTNPGATKPPSRSSTSAPGNWLRPTSSPPNHATTSPRTAMAVASGWVGLCTRPLTSSLVETVTGQNYVCRRLWRVVPAGLTRESTAPFVRQRGRVELPDVNDLTVDVVAVITRIPTTEVRESSRIRDHRYPSQTTDRDCGQTRARDGA